MTDRVGPALDSYDSPYYGRDAELVPVATSRRRENPTVDVIQRLDDLRNTYLGSSRQEISLELLKIGAALTDVLDVARWAVLAAAVLRQGEWFVPFVDDAGPVACLHSQLTAWRHQPGGLTRKETMTAARLTRGREPITI